MNGRGGVVTFFLFLFLSLIVLLQILLMVQSDRFYDGLNRLDEVFESGTIVYGSKGEGEVSIDEYKRNKLSHRLHRILHEEQAYTFLFTRPTFCLVDKRFKNVKIHNLGLKYWEWYLPKEQQRYKL